MHRHLDERDHEMHELRNRALCRVLSSILRSEVTRVQAARARDLSRRSKPTRRAHLHLVKG